MNYYCLNGITGWSGYPAPTYTLRIKKKKLLYTKCLYTYNKQYISHTTFSASFICLAFYCLTKLQESDGDGTVNFALR